VIKNGNKTAEIYVENRISILREKDIMSQERANTPCKRIYFVIQLMYIDNGKLADYRNVLRELLKETLHAAPSTHDLIEQIVALTNSAMYYQALKIARKLINYEKELLSHVQ